MVVHWDLSPSGLGFPVMDHRKDTKATSFSHHYFKKIFLSSMYPHYMVFSLFSSFIWATFIKSFCFILCFFYFIVVYSVSDCVLSVSVSLHVFFIHSLFFNPSPPHQTSLFYKMHHSRLMSRLLVLHHQGQTHVYHIWYIWINLFCPVCLVS